MKTNDWARTTDWTKFSNAKQLVEARRLRRIAAGDLAQASWLLLNTPIHSDPGTLNQARGFAKRLQDQATNLNARADDLDPLGLTVNR